LRPQGRRARGPVRVHLGRDHFGELLPAKWTGAASGDPLLQSPAAWPDRGDQGLPALRRGGALRLAAPRPDPVRGRGVLLRLSRPRAVRLAVPALRGARARCHLHRWPAQQPRRFPEPGVRPGLPYRREGAGGVRRVFLAHRQCAQGYRRAALAQVNPNITLDDTRSFHSDSLWNYELGAKTAWLDHRLTLNAAGFYIKWPHIQQAVLLPCGFQFIANAGAAESKGGELELRAAATEHLQASLGVGYQDAKITEAGESAQAVGSPVFDVPNWTGNGALSYTMPIGNAWSFMGEVDYSYVGSSFSSSNSSPVPRERPAYRLLDARLALSSGATEIALVGKNLSNTVTNLGDNRSIAAEVPGRPRLFLNQPRTIGVEIREHF